MSRCRLLPLVLSRWHLLKDKSMNRPLALKDQNVDWLCDVTRGCLDARKDCIKGYGDRPLRSLKLLPFAYFFVFYFLYKNQ